VEPYRERIEDFLRRWRSRYEGDRVFRVLVITVVLAAYAVTSASLQQTPTYEASTLVWVDWQQEGQWTNSGGSGEQIQTLEFRELPIQTIAPAIESRPIAEEAIRRLELEMTPEELLDYLTVEQIEDTQFIRLTYEDTDPMRAQQIANTVGEVSSEFISQRSNEFMATVWERAAVPENPVSPHPLRNGLLTLVIGLMLCAWTVVVRPGVGARVAGTLSEWAVRPIGQAGVLGRRHSDPSIVERIKEKKLLLALGRRGKLTAVEAALETSLSVEEANRMLFELAARGHLEVTVEHGKLLYSFWGEHGA
jgi:capsular polysaccharide biosynthesis protein